MLQTDTQLDRLARLDPSARGSIAKTHVEATLDRVRDAFAKQAPPQRILQFMADEIDRLVTALFVAAVPHVVSNADSNAESPDSSQDAAGLCLIALGGYGRGELFPYSDLDLLVLQQTPQEVAQKRAETGDADRAAQVMEEVIYPLWDARIAVGHAVRTVHETLELAEKDLTARTALLDARMLCGDPAPFQELQRSGKIRFFGPHSVAQFVQQLHQERANRHKRFGVTEYLLEPNIKQSKGGLRDLDTALWATAARFGVAEIAQLGDVGVGNLRQIRSLSEAQQFLQRLRIAMHLEAGRAQNHLSFELQERLGPRFFPGPDLPGIRRSNPAVAPAVERLMNAFYRHAHTIVLESDGLLERCASFAEDDGAAGRPATDRANEHFVLSQRRISTVEPLRLWEEPAEIVRAFAVALSHRAALDRTTKDAISEAAAEVPGTHLLADETAAALLVQMLCDPERAELGGILEEMHHLGVLCRMIPEFGACAGRIQHDLYHVYTVDLHSLYVVALLKAWLRGEQADSFPTPVAVMAKLKHHQAMMLAGLLHDIGKPYGPGHSAKGQRLAEGVAARLGLGVEVQKEVGFLVRNHLIMAYLSQRRDLSDPAIVSAFAEQVQKVQRLRHLYLLTAADTAMTAPGNLTEWKASLLDGLFMKTYRLLVHGQEERDRRRTAQLTERRDGLELLLRRRFGAPGGRILARVPDELLLSFHTADLLHHLTVAVEAEALGASQRIGARHLQGESPQNTPHNPDDAADDPVYELTVCCLDSPGRLATITGLLLLNRIEILEAQVFTLEPRDGANEQLVLDIFRVQPDAATLTDETIDGLGDQQQSLVWDRLGGMLQRAVDGELAVNELVRRRTRPSSLKGRVVPRVPIEVIVDNDASDRFTVIEVEAPDLPGVLHAITREVSDLSLEIQLSKVASEAGRVVDVFYVRESDGHEKLLDGDRIEALQGNIARAIERLAPGRRAKAGS